MAPGSWHFRGLGACFFVSECRDGASHRSCGCWTQPSGWGSCGGPARVVAAEAAEAVMGLRCLESTCLKHRAGDVFAAGPPGEAAGLSGSSPPLRRHLSRRPSPVDRLVVEREECEEGEVRIAPIMEASAGSDLALHVASASRARQERAV